MTTFFLIAGFFAHMSFHKRGPRHFIVDRLKRIALPLVVAWPLVFAAVVAVGLWAVVAAHGGVLPKGPAPAWPKFPGFPLTHLWFLYVLLEFYAVSLIVRSGVALVDRDGAWRGRLDRVVAAIVESGFAPVALAVPVATAFALDPQWMMWFGVPTPDGAFVTNAVALTGFGAAFGFGWLLHRQTGLLAAIQRGWALNLMLAAGLIGSSLAIAGLTPMLKPLAPGWTHLVGSVCYALTAWTSTFAVIGLALRFWSDASPVRRYIADASYWVYIIHLPIVMALQVMVARPDWPAALKLLVILGLAFPLMFASYELMVRHGFIGAVLNGARVPRKAEARLPTQATLSTPKEALR
jgi:hypothetical protein